MGCASSTVEEVEPVKKCKERRRLIKQLLGCRPELAAAYIAYLRSLRNTGAALRELAEVETSLPPASGSPIHHTPHSSWQPPPPSPPLSPQPLPPSPPHLPHLNFSISGKGKKVEDSDGDSLDDTDSCQTPLPPPPPDFDDWENWDPRGYMANMSSPLPLNINNYNKMAADVGMEDGSWEEASTISDDGEPITKVGNAQMRSEPTVPGITKVFRKEYPDDNASVVSSGSKGLDEDSSTLLTEKTLVSIVTEIDEIFLKAAESGKDVVFLLESSLGMPQMQDLNGTKGRSSRSSKVFSWSWSVRSTQSHREASNLNLSNENKHNYHCKTLEKLYENEMKVHKEVKDAETAMVQYSRNTSLLQNLESRNGDMLYMERIRENLEELQIRIISLQESVSLSCSTISKIRDQELYPQLIELTAGLVHMWRIMHECHEAQRQITQQISLLENHFTNQPTTDSHCRATIQLEAEVTLWHSSFCNLTRLQREYMAILTQWISLTDSLPDDDGLMCSSSGILVLCEQVQHALDKIPDKMAADAIKSFASAIRSLVRQQNEERQLKKKAETLERKLEKQMSTLDASAASSSARNLYPSSMADARLESFKKKTEEEKARYRQSVKSSRAMATEHLQASLGDVFRALAEFTGNCVQAFEKIDSA